eukprot:RCo012112
MGCVCSEPGSSSREYTVTPPPHNSISTSTALPAVSAERPGESPLVCSHSHTLAPTSLETSALVKQSEDRKETNAEKEVHVAIEKGSAAELHAVLSLRQPSHEQLREEPFCSMMYRAARSGHVEVME